MRRAVNAACDRLRQAWLRLWEPWRDFWFAPADPTSLGLMRILIGGMLLYTHAVWGLRLEGFFGANGWQDESLVRLVQADPWIWSFWWHVPAALHVAAHILSMGILLSFMLGVATPVTSILAWAITVSYCYRAPLANYGLDQINAIAALYLAIGPSGQTLSLDRLWRRYRVARSRLLAGEPVDLPPVRPSARANLALRLLQVHLCVIYIFACLSKLQGESWWNGQAIWQAVSNLEYQSRDATWLAWYPWLANLLTHATIVWEMTFWALVWKPLCRPFVLLAGVAIHLGIGAFMGMWTFGLAVAFTYLAFVPGRSVAAVMSAVGRFPRRIVEAWIGRSPRADDLRVRALCAALALDPRAARDRTPNDEWQRPAPADAPVRTAVATAAPTAVAEENEPPAEAPTPVDGARAPVVVDEARPPVLRTPTLVLVESRVKRQTEIQEYLFRHGFRCYVASELHQARSLLSVVDVELVIVMAGWIEVDELAAFRDSLVAGSRLPASIFLLHSAQKSATGRFEEHPCHRVVFNGLSLRGLRLTVLDLLGLPEEPFRRRPHGSKNGESRAASSDHDGDESPTSISDAELRLSDYSLHD